MRKEKEKKVSRKKVVVETAAREILKVEKGYVISIVNL